MSTFKNKMVFLGFEMDKISVIVPVYNVERYIRRCVDSIINQTYRNLQIILVDDGSNDSSGQICDDYASRDPRIEVIHKKNAGLGFARNSGLGIATGKYVTFVDSDDYIADSMIEHLYQCLIINNADTCIGGSTRVLKDGSQIKTHQQSKTNYISDEIKNELLVRMLGSQGNDYIEMSVWKVLFSKDIIDKYHIMFPSERVFISEDIIFDLDYYPQCHKVTMCDDNGYYYCDNEGSLTNKYNPERFEKQVILFEELVKKTKKLGIYSIAEQRLINTLVSIARYSIKLEAFYTYLNGKKQTINNIKRICNNRVLLEYMPLLDKKNIKRSSQCVNWLITKKKAVLLYLVMNIKNTFNL